MRSQIEIDIDIDIDILHRPSTRRSDPLSVRVSLSPSSPHLSLNLLPLLLLDLQQQRAVDMRQHTTKRNRRLDEGVEFLVTADRELQVARRDAFDLEVLGGVAGQLEHFGGEVLEDGGDVDGGFGANAHLVLRLGFEETLDTAAGELPWGEDESVLLSSS
jgi:hypothetical protein